MELAEGRRWGSLLIYAACAPALHQLWERKVDGFALLWSILAVGLMGLALWSGRDDYLNERTPLVVAHLLVISAVVPAFFGRR